MTLDNLNKAYVYLIYDKSYMLNETRCSSGPIPSSLFDSGCQI